MHEMNKFIPTITKLFYGRPKLFLDLFGNFSSNSFSTNYSKNTCKTKTGTESYSRQETYQETQNPEWRPKQESLKSQTKDMQVLGVMHQGANTFEKIQRNENRFKRT